MFAVPYDAVFSGAVELRALAVRPFSPLIAYLTFVRVVDTGAGQDEAILFVSHWIVETDLVGDYRTKMHFDPLDCVECKKSKAFIEKV